MSATYTVGDGCEVDCPWCGDTLYIQDLAVDDCLKTGYEEECRKCGRAWQITAVDYDVTVWVDRVEKKPVAEAKP